MFTALALSAGIFIGWEGHKLYLRRLVKIMRTIRLKLRGK